MYPELSVAIRVEKKKRKILYLKFQVSGVFYRVLKNLEVIDRDKESSSKEMHIT